MTALGAGGHGDFPFPVVISADWQAASYFGGGTVCELPVRQLALPETETVQFVSVRQAPRSVCPGDGVLGSECEVSGSDVEDLNEHVMIRSP